MNCGRQVQQRKDGKFFFLPTFDSQNASRLFIKKIENRQLDQLQSILVQIFERFQCFSASSLDLHLRHFFAVRKFLSRVSASTNNDKHRRRLSNVPFSHPIYFDHHHCCFRILRFYDCYQLYHSHFALFHVHILSLQLHHCNN